MPAIKLCLIAGTAFTKFFRKETNFPTFKKKGGKDSFALWNDQFRLENKKVKIPNLGWVRMTEVLRFSGKILSATVSRTAHKWFISITVDTGSPKPKPINSKTIGVDVGVKDLATLSTGEKIVGGKHLKRNLKKLKRLSKSFSRKKKKSKNWTKAKSNLARLHYKISCLRSDYLHKLTTFLFKSYGNVVIEDLNVAGMVKNRKLSRHIIDASFGEMRRQLEYKSEIYGGNLWITDRWYPSSKTCSSCGHVLEELKLGTREWECPSCHAKLDRDVNAAVNLERLLVGKALPDPSCIELYKRKTVDSKALDTPYRKLPVRCVETVLDEAVTKPNSKTLLSTT